MRSKPAPAVPTLAVAAVLLKQAAGIAQGSGTPHAEVVGTVTKEQVREITSRNRGHNVKTVIDELDSYIRGWLGYYKLSSSYKEVLALSVWVRRRVRLYYWKQWKQPRTRRRHLLTLGADPKTVHMAPRSRKGYWRMSQNEIVRFALNNRWLEEQGVPDMRAIWIVLHHGQNARV